MSGDEIKGSIEVMVIGPSYVRLDMSNTAAAASSSVVLHHDALCELRDIINQVLNAELPGAILNLDRTGSSV